jgi:hypothetical protein
MKHFPAVPRDLTVQAVAAGWIIAGDINGDSKADFSIEVRDNDHPIVWIGADLFGLI